MKRALAAILLMSWQSLTLAGAQEAEWCISKHGESVAAPCFNLPDWVLCVARSAKFPAEYDLSHHLNPYFQSGDFDADGKLDVAVLVRQKSTGQSGIAIFLYGKLKPVVLGAGRSFGNGGTDFSWMDNWSVYPKAGVRKSPWEDKPPAPRRKRQSNQPRAVERCVNRPVVRAMTTPDDLIAVRWADATRLTMPRSIGKDYIFEESFNGTCSSIKVDDVHNRRHADRVW